MAVTVFSHSPQRQTIERPVSLREWFSLNSFYSPSFKLQRIEEREHALWALGENLAYHFPLAEGEPRQIWRRLCNEIIDARQLLPGVYTGIRAYDIVQGVPIWLDDEPALNFNPLQPPRSAKSAALCMRRLFDDRSLQSLLFF